jgi:hypothetical protein
LLVEAKQRKAGVKWLFFHLPKTESTFNVAPEGVPVATTGFELRPGQVETSGDKSNPKDVANGLAQLQYGFVPFHVHLAQENQPELPQHQTTYALEEHNITWLVLVTSAELFMFTPPEAFKDLEGQKVAGRFFRPVPWVLCQPEQNLNLRTHQTRCMEVYWSSGSDTTQAARRQRVRAEMRMHSPEVHVVNFEHLPRFLELVDNPPRIKEIQISVSVDGAPPGDPIVIK